MAARFPNVFRREPKPPREATPHFSHLQKAILGCLYREGQRRQRRNESTAIPFPTLVQGLQADKADIVLSLRRLMTKDFVEVSLPRGAWTRSVSLTEKGAKHAKTLSKETTTAAAALRHPGNHPHDRDDNREDDHERERRRR